MVSVLAVRASALQIIGNQLIEVNIPINQTEYYDLVIYNDANETLEANVSLTGNVSQVATLITNNVTVEPFGIGHINISITSNEEGYWEGNVNISGILVPIRVTCSRFHSTGWYRAGQVLTVQPGDYRIRIINVSDTAYIITLKSGYLLEARNYNINDKFKTSDFEFVIRDMFQDMVKIEIISNYLDTTVSVSGEGESGEEEGGFGSFSFYITTYANTITSDTTLKEQFILRNGLNKAVMLKTIEYSGTVVTQEGRQPINAVQYTLGLLQPGQETTFVVEINTKGLSPGMWTPTMTVKGLTEDNKIVSATINFALTVTKSTLSPSSENITISYPEEVEANKEFEIVVSGLTSGMSVDMEPNPHLIGTNITMEDGNWTWKGYLDVNETQQVTIYVKLLGGMFKTFRFNLTVPKQPEPLSISYTPLHPWVGEEIKITTYPVNATITIDGNEYTPPFIPLIAKNYTIKATAEGYLPAEEVIEVLPQITANVTGKRVGDTVKIQFSRKETYTVKLNNTTIKTATGNVLSFVPNKEGIYTVYDSEGHEIVSFTIEKKGFSLNFSKIKNWLINILIGVLAIIVILLIIKKLTTRKSEGITFRMGGSRTPGPVEEEEE